MAELTFMQQPGGGAWVAEAVNWEEDDRPHLNIGITKAAILARSARGQRWILGQMYKVVGTGMILAKHVFRGLRRDMLVGDDDTADKKKLAITWVSPRDAKLTGPASACQVEYEEAPEGCVFVVYVSPNEMLKDFPNIYGWAEHWAWLPADSNLPGAPIDWETRYDSRIWSMS